MECGQGVTNVRPGDRVCTEWFAHCGQCRFCLTGDYHLCSNIRPTSGGSHAGFAEFVIAHASSLFTLRPEMTFAEGAFVEPAAVGYHAARISRAAQPDTALIIGCGTIGLVTLAAAKVFGIGRIIAAARHPHQAACARELGADEVVLSEEGDTLQKINDLTGGLGADVVFETTASQAGFKNAVSAVRKKGLVMIMGGYTGAISMSLQRVMEGEICLMGSNCYSYGNMRRDFEWTMDLIVSGRMPARKLITHEFPLERIHEAFAAALDKDSGSIKVQVHAGGEE